MRLTHTKKRTEGEKSDAHAHALAKRTYVLCEVQVKCYLDDEVKSYEVVLLGFFIIIILLWIS